MEESKELQGFYKIFRAVVYVSVLLEFFEYAIDPAVFDQWGGILTDIHGRIKRWTIYQDGQQNDVMLVRICVAQDAMFPTTGIGLGLPKNAGGYGLVAVTAFVIEPS